MILMSSGVVPTPRGSCTMAAIRFISTEEAKEKVLQAYRQGALKIAVGHKASAKVLSQIFGIKITPRRGKITLRAGSEAIQLVLGERLPKNAKLSEKELLEKYSIQFRHVVMFELNYFPSIPSFNLKRMFYIIPGNCPNFGYTLDESPSLRWKLVLLSFDEWEILRKRDVKLIPLHPAYLWEILNETDIQEEVLGFLLKLGRFLIYPETS